MKVHAPFLAALVFGVVAGPGCSSQKTTNLEVRPQSAAVGIPMTAVQRKILGRWEGPKGTRPMVFFGDGRWQTSFWDGTIDGRYRVTNEGKIECEASSSEVRLSSRYFFDGEVLTDGAVYFETGRREWHRVEAK